MLATSHVIGGLPVALHDASHWVSHNDWACAMLPTLVMPLPKMVMTTSAVIRMTMAATTTVNVMFIFNHPDLCIYHRCKKVLFR